VETLISAARLTDADVVARVRAGETALFEILMRRHNQRLYRVARAVLKDETEAEDAMQQAYVNAFVHLDQFEERAQFSTWLTRITVHEALARRRRTNARASVTTNGDEPGDLMATLVAPQPDPERQASVKTRLHRARAMLRRSITDQVGAVTAEAFHFHAVRCDRVVAAVLAEIRQRHLDST